MKKVFSAILFILSIVFFVMIYPTATKRHLSRVVQIPSGMYGFDVFTFKTKDLETMKDLNTFYNYTFISNDEYLKIKNEILKYQVFTVLLGLMGLTCVISGIYLLSGKGKRNIIPKSNENYTEPDQIT